MDNYFFSPLGTLKKGKSRLQAYIFNASGIKRCMDERRSPVIKAGFSMTTGYYI
jgi:hypothetical protein